MFGLFKKKKEVQDEMLEGLEASFKEAEKIKYSDYDYLRTPRFDKACKREDLWHDIIDTWVDYKFDNGAYAKDIFDIVKSKDDEEKLCLQFKDTNCPFIAFLNGLDFAEHAGITYKSLSLYKILTEPLFDRTVYDSAEIKYICRDAQNLLKGLDKLMTYLLEHDVPIQYTRVSYCGFGTFDLSARIRPFEVEPYLELISQDKELKYLEEYRKYIIDWLAETAVSNANRSIDKLQVEYDMPTAYVSLYDDFEQRENARRKREADNKLYEKIITEIKTTAKSIIKENPECSM